VNFIEKVSQVSEGPQMASPSASSATLSELLDDEISLDIDDLPTSDAEDDEDGEDNFVSLDEHNNHPKRASPSSHSRSKREASSPEPDTNPCLLRDVLSDGSTYVLPDHYTNPQFVSNQDSLSPSMRAASDPDPRVLKAILSNGSNIYNERINADLQIRRKSALSMIPHAPAFDFPVSDMSSEFGSNSLRVVCGSKVGITTPLMEAIREGLPDNVSTLLKAGANPNGVPLQVMEDYAAFFLRFRPMIPSFTDEEGDVASRDVLLKCMDLPQISSITWRRLKTDSSMG
jgi:hypothetical protein